MITRELEHKPWGPQAWRSEDVLKSYREAQQRKDQKWLQAQIKQLREVSNTSIEV